MQQVVHGVMAGVPIPFPLENPDACHNTGLTCPLPVGDHTYQYALFVKPVYPKVSLKPFFYCSLNHLKWNDQLSPICSI